MTAPEKAKVAVHGRLMKFRPLAQFLGHCVAQDIDARVADGRLQANQLPLHVHRVLLKQAGAQMRVDLNEEVRLFASVPVKRSVIAGEGLSAEDIKTDDCYLEPPAIDGERVAFFYARSIYLDVHSMFDFTPNGPNGPGEGRMRYPIAEIGGLLAFTEQIKPTGRYADLAAHNWPPGCAYFPKLFAELASGAVSVKSPQFAEMIAGIYDKEYWETSCGFWEEIGSFPSRMRYIRKAVEEYFDGDFISSIRVIAPEFEGVVRSHLRQSGLTPAQSQRACLKQFRDLVLSRRFVMFPPDLLDLILGFVENHLMKNTEDVTNPSQEVSRHGVAHGVFAGFEERDIALKYLVLADALAFVVFHDRLVTNRLVPGPLDV